MAERGVSAEPPRVGVFVCGCNGSISDVVDLPAVVASAAGLPGVVHAECLPSSVSPMG